jgi:hypothetical protein
MALLRPYPVRFAFFFSQRLLEFFNSTATGSSGVCPENSKDFALGPIGAAACVLLEGEVRGTTGGSAVAAKGNCAARLRVVVRAVHQTRSHGNPTQFFAGIPSKKTMPAVVFAIPSGPTAQKSNRGPMRK